MRLLQGHHSVPRYREVMYGSWKQNQRAWNQWSPQLPKKANRQNRKKEENLKDQQAGVLRAYDAAPGGGSSSTSSTSNNAGQQEALFFKEFVNFVKETKCDLPENLQKFLPNEDKENLREQQKKLNKQRNLHAKINNKQKALEQDKERWTSWIASVKEEIQLQKGKHEESQKKLSKELEDLQEELRRLNNNEEETIEIIEDQDIEEILDTMTSKAEEEETSKKLEEMQAEMEQKYQLQIEEERRRMQQHFSEQFNMEAGIPTSTSKLLQRARKGAMARLERLEEHFKLEESPTLVQLEGAFRHVAKGKAGGADGFLSNVCYAAPKEMAQKYFPVMMKMLSMLEEPLPMKGGVLVAAFKGGNESNPQDYRSLLLSSHPGKAIRRAIRQQLIGPYTASTPDTFFSIRPGGNVAHASQSLRLFASASAQSGASTGILYLDVKAAYYRVIRQLAVRGSEANSIERVMAHFDLGATELRAACRGQRHP